MRHPVTRRRFLAVTGTTALAGCASVGSSTGSNQTPDQSSPTTGSADDSTATPSARDSSGPPIADESYPLPLRPDILRARSQSGGPPKDGIPSIDSPNFESATAADRRLSDDTIVFGLERNGEAKAYLQSILVWHEICNDTIGGEPVSVTYCPLTGTVLGFERGDTEFGVSGSLVNNNLIMYDRATENWWPQVLATAIPGWGESFVGRSLKDFRLVWTSWDRWQSAHPDTKVLTTETGFARDYNRDPYGTYNPLGGYYRPNEDPLFSPLHPDDRHPPKEVFIGARGAEGAITFHKERLRDEKLLEGTMGDVPVIAVYDDTLDTGYVYRNPNEQDYAYVDGQVEGPNGNVAPNELELREPMTMDTMWFAWMGFYPDSEVHA